MKPEIAAAEADAGRCRPHPAETPAAEAPVANEEVKVAAIAGTAAAGQPRGIDRQLSRWRKRRRPKATSPRLKIATLGGPAVAIEKTASAKPACFTMGSPAAMNNDFMTSLSMPAAEPSTPAPT